MNFEGLTGISASFGEFKELLDLDIGRGLHLQAYEAMLNFGQGEGFHGYHPRRKPLAMPYPVSFAFPLRC
ncbi:hypothetical protein AgCh_033882 [Apium graveolens]